MQFKQVKINASICDVFSSRMSKCALDCPSQPQDAKCLHRADMLHASKWHNSAMLLTEQHTPWN